MTECGQLHEWADQVEVAAQRLDGIQAQVIVVIWCSFDDS